MSAGPVRLPGPVPLAPGDCAADPPATAIRVLTTLLDPDAFPATGSRPFAVASEGNGQPGWQKEFNTAENRIRYVIAHFKTWRIMHIDYRPPIDTFATTISAVIGPHFYRMA